MYRTTIVATHPLPVMSASLREALAALGLHVETFECVGTFGVTGAAYTHGAVSRRLVERIG